MKYMKAPVNHFRMIDILQTFTITPAQFGAYRNVCSFSGTTCIHKLSCDTSTHILKSVHFSNKNAQYCKRRANITLINLPFARCGIGHHIKRWLSEACKLYLTWIFMLDEVTQINVDGFLWRYSDISHPPVCYPLPFYAHGEKRCRIHTAGQTFFNQYVH